MRVIHRIGYVIFLIFYLACGEDDAVLLGSRYTLEVIVTPDTVTIAPGTAVQLTARVSGIVNQSVTWTLLEGPGSISRSGLYSAPAALEDSMAMARIGAVAQADSRVSGMAVIFIRDLSNVRVAIEPSEVVLPLGGAQQFVATVSGLDDSPVIWSIDTGPGEVSANGLYSAPDTLSADSALVVVRATALLAPQAYDQARVIVRGPRSTVPAPARGFTLPHQAHTIIETAAALCVETVLRATELTRSAVPVTTGTVLQSLNGPFRYRDIPTDRLRLRFVDGTGYEFVVFTMLGSTAGSARDFLFRDHQLSFQFRPDEETDLFITANRVDGNLENRLSGVLLEGNLPHTADLQGSGFYSREAGGGFVELSATEAFSGTIAARDIALTVDESYQFKQILLEDDDRLLENITRIIRNVWQVKEDRYSANTALIREAFLNGRPVQVESFWAASGEVLENEAVIGEISVGSTPEQVEILLETPQDTLILEQYPR